MQSGMAQVWRNVVSQQIYRGENIYHLAQHFLNDIDLKFGDMDKRTTALLKLRTMTQGDKHADEGRFTLPHVIHWNPLENSGIPVELSGLQWNLVEF